VSYDAIKMILVMSISGSVLTLVLFILKPLIKNRLPKTTQYYLWFVVIVSLLVPVSKIIILPVNTTETTTISSTVDWYFVSAKDVDERIKPYEVDYGILESKAEEVDTLVPDLWVTEFVEWCRLIYPLGVMATVGYLFLSYYFYIESLKRRNKAACDNELLLLSELCGNRRVPQLYHNAKAATPMLIGLFEPAIILPDRDFSDKQLHSVLLHELTHLRRKDILIKWLSVLACSLHWFNPLAWFARREIDRACELACDEAVIRKLDADGKQSYGDTLIAVAVDSKMPHTVLSTTMCERKKSLKERLGAIMEHKKPTRVAIIVSTVLIIAAVLTACALGAGSKDNEVGVVPDNLNVSQAVLDAAKDYVSEWYSDTKKEVNYNTDNWRIDKLEQTCYYAESGIVLYAIDWSLHVTNPEKVGLAGGMRFEDDDWLIDHYPNSYYLIFDDHTGDMADLRYITHFFSNDSKPGQESFDKEINERLQQFGTGAALAVTNKEPSTPNRESGIFENVSNQLDADVEFTNGWRSPLVDLDENGEGGKFIIVQVGSLKSDPEQGIAVVCHQNKDGEQYVIDDKFLTPSKHGAIKIESLGAKDFTMSVVAEDGYEWIFSLYNGFYNNGNTLSENTNEANKEDYLHSLTDNDVTTAQKVAEAYYETLPYSLTAIDLDSDMGSFLWEIHGWGNDNNPDAARFTFGNLIVFDTRISEFPETPRQIALGRENESAQWEVINEGL
jgi:beta-lactamase regulating signal transducer with metallopeptidase domain